MPVSRERSLLRLVAAGVAAAAFVVGTVAAGPASAATGAIGAIESVSVTYTGASGTPYLRISGWAGDLGRPTANGSSDGAVELFATPPGGTATSIAWVGHEQFSVARPDIAAAHPPLGGFQGFLVNGALVPQTGPLTICAKLQSSTGGPWAPIGCASIEVPAARPATAVIAGTGRVGTTLSVQGAGAGDTVVWLGSSPVHPGAPAPIPGAVATTYSPTTADIGSQLRAVVTTMASGRAPIIQTTDPVTASFPADSIRSVEGVDRLGTSITASRLAFPDGSAGVPVVYIASGRDFPDALSAGPAAAVRHGSLLLTDPGALDQRIADELTRLHPPAVVIAGGPAAVSDAVVSAIGALSFHPEVRRVWGADRYQTSRAIDSDAFGLSVPAVYLASGRSFPDALSAGAAAAGQGVPVLLTDGRGDLDDATRDVLAQWGTQQISIAGGPVSISAAIADRLAGTATVQRLAGPDRFATSAAIAAAAPPSGTAYIASGLGFPDALSAATLAGAVHGPLLLSTGTCLAVSELDVLVQRGAADIHILGGWAVQGPTVSLLAAC